MDEWTTEPSSDLVSSMTAMCEDLSSLRTKIKELEDEAKKLSEKKKEIERKLLNHMKETGLNQLKGSFGTVSIVHKKSISQPGSFEDKLQFFEYLKEQGIFEQMVSVNSRTLQSWVGKEIEAKEKEGVLGWLPPGIKEPVEYQEVRLTKR